MNASAPLLSHASPPTVPPKPPIAPATAPADEPDSPIVFSPHQDAYIESNWQKPLLDLTREVFANPTLKTSSPEYRAVKERIVTLGKNPPSVPKSKQAVEKVELTDIQKSDIRGLLVDSTGPFEIAKIIFKNPYLQPASREVRAIALYCREADPSYKREEDQVEDLDYQPPSSRNELIGKVNRYAIAFTSDGKKMLNPTGLTPVQSRNLQALLTFMQTPLFKIEADKCVKRVDRELFESTFIKFCWDKPDLLAEEVDQYISLAAETVNFNMIDRMVKKLDERIQNLINEAGEGKIALNMAEVELLTSVREKANASMKQKAALLKTLTVARSARMAAKQEANSSLHNLVDAFRNEVDRKKIIETVERQKRDPLRKEIERLSTIDSIKAELFGLNKEDILR